MDQKNDNEIVLKDSERTRCEVWTRVMGYHRPISYYNIGKKGEFAERKYFDENITCANIDDNPGCCGCGLK